MSFCKCAWCEHSMPLKEGGWHCTKAYCTMSYIRMNEILRMIGGK